MYSPAPGIFPRIASQDVIINGTKIKKGAKVRVNTLPLWFSEEYFDNPFEFNPNRWKESKL